MLMMPFWNVKPLNYIKSVLLLAVKLNNSAIYSSNEKSIYDLVVIRNFKIHKKNYDNYEFSRITLNVRFCYTFITIEDMSS